MKKMFTLLFLVVVISINVPAQNLLDSLHQEIQAVFQATEIPGFAYSIVNQEQVLASKGYGFADIAGQKAYTPETVHNIGSVSKTFIAAAIMQLVEQGKLSLDTKINEVLPFNIIHPKHPDVPITVKHLVTHTSGIKDGNFYNFGCYVLLDEYEPIKKNYKGLEAFYLKRISKNSEQALGDFIKAHLAQGGASYKKKNFYKHQPGTKYEYSNIASAVTAYVVEVVTGQDYADYVREHIMQPIAMKDSGWSYADIPAGKHATTYTPKGSIVPKYTLITYPDGGVRSSAADLGKYLQAMIKQDNRLMQAATYQDMFATKFEGAADKVAVFWSFDRRDNITHNGADPGIFTMVLFDPEERVGFTFTTNCSVHEDKKLMIPTVGILRILRAYSLKLQAVTEEE